MTVAATVRAEFSPFGSRLWRIWVRRPLLLLASFVLALTLTSGSWPGAPTCKAAPDCAIALADIPIAIGGATAIVELWEEFAAEGLLGQADDTHKHGTTPYSIRFVALAASGETTVAGRLRRVLFPDKTGPPRA